MTAADRYALSLLPQGLKGTGLGDGQAPTERGGHGAASAPQAALRMQRGNQGGIGAGASMLQTMPPQLGVGPQQHLPPPLDSRVVNSWDASLKEILAALEPDTRSTVKPVRA